MKVCIPITKPQNHSIRRKFDFYGFLAEIVCGFFVRTGLNFDFLILTRYLGGSRLTFEPRLILKCRVPLMGHFQENQGLKGQTSKNRT